MPLQRRPKPEKIKDSSGYSWYAMEFLGCHDLDSSFCEGLDEICRTDLFYSQKQNCFILDVERHRREGDVRFERQCFDDLKLAREARNHFLVDDVRLEPQGHGL